jgi:hypothetical protein
MPTSGNPPAQPSQTPGRSKSRLLSIFKSLATVIGLFVAYLALDIFMSYRMAPPSSDCTLAELAERLPPPQHLALVDTPAGKRLVWIGDTPWLVVRSGPPCYAFDDRCRLVGWSAETNEGGRLDELARAAWNATSLSLKEALQRCEASARDSVEKKRT